MELTVDMNTMGFKALCEDLAKVSGKDFKEIVRLQAGAVLKRVMGKTKAANATKLRNRAKKIAALERGYFRQRDGSALIIGTSSNMRFWKDYSPKTDRPTVYPINEWRLPDQVWNRYTQAVNRIAPRMKAMAKKILGARGVSKQTWLEIAKVFGVDYILKAPAYVYKAKSTSKRVYRNTEGKEFFSMHDAYLVMKQRYKNLTENGFAAVILQAAIRARIKAFSTDVNRGVFKDAKKRAARYPGVFVSEGTTTTTT